MRRKAVKERGGSEIEDMGYAALIHTRSSCLQGCGARIRGQRATYMSLDASFFYGEPCDKPPLRGASCRSFLVHLKFECALPQELKGFEDFTT